MRKIAERSRSFSLETARKATLTSVGHDLIVVGDSNPDLVLTGEVVPAFDQVEKLVDAAELTLGGSASIVAAGGTRLGLRTALIAVVGDDPLGRLQLEALRSHDVDLRGMITDPELPTGITVVLSRGGDRAILTSPGSIASLTVGMLDRELLFGGRHVHISSYFLQRRLWEGLPDLLRSLREARITTSLDTNWDPSGAWQQALGDVLPAVDVFLPNLAEARRLTGEEDADTAARHLAEVVDVVALKLGAEGAIAYTGTERVRAVPPAVSAVDTTGAGDGFTAGFLAGRLRAMPLEACLRLACACGALSTRALGGTRAQASFDEAAAAASL
jgi:sugar/nucleoside kinase (ribokinase family)